MKTRLLLTVLSLSLILGCTPGKAPAPAASLPHHQGPIRITGAYALYPLTRLWVDEYSKTHPGALFDLTSGGTGTGLEAVLTGKADIGMVSNEIPYEADKVLWNAPVARLAVVPVINAKNPFLDLIREKGITHDQLSGIFAGTGPASWNRLYGSPKETPIHVYVRADKAGASQVWQNFLFLDSTEIKGIPVNGEDQLIDQVIRDPLAISYCNFVNACNPAAGKIRDGILVLAIDINHNGKIDPREDYTGDYTTLQRAMWSGRYPHVLVRDLYFVMKGKPASREVVDFLKWILTEGQNLIPNAGYIELHTSEIRCRMNFLNQIDSLPGAR
ncbi:MAG TPA: substrate-binding domain-containing protein [Bacteroidales bacterium]|nr:substrate-binding domain-containing protein [Bacteroidales bacterium]